MTKMERWLAYINRELTILDYNSDHYNGPLVKTTF